MLCFQTHKPAFIPKIILWKGNLKLRWKNIQMITKRKGNMAILSS